MTAEVPPEDGPEGLGLVESHNANRVALRITTSTVRLHTIDVRVHVVDAHVARHDGRLAAVGVVLLLVAVLLDQADEDFLWCGSGRKGVLQSVGADLVPET